MQLDKLADIIKSAETENFGEESPRRDVLKKMGLKIAALTVPFVALSSLNKAFGQTTDALIDTLNYALQLKYLQHEFYKKGLEMDSFIQEDLDSYKKILADKQGHINILKYLIGDLGGAAADAPSFDFSGGAGKAPGPFAKAFSNYLDFLAMAQMLEDSVCRAYIDVAGSLVPRDTLVYHIFKIRSVDARHAAHIRGLRAPYGVKSWITGIQTGMDNTSAIPFYAGEQNHVEMGINVENINGYTLSADTVSEAFDEPMSRPTATDLFAMFIVS